MLHSPRRWPPAGVVRYRGEQLLISGRLPESAGPAAWIRIAAVHGGAASPERRIRVDPDGQYAFSIDVRTLPRSGNFVLTVDPAGQGEAVPSVTIRAIAEASRNPACRVPVNEAGDDDTPAEPGICTCTSCPPDRTLDGSSLDAFTRSETPRVEGVEVVTGKVRTRFPITAFNTRLLGFDFGLHHCSLVSYDGPWGQGFLHSFGFMIVEHDATTGQIVTPDLRIFDIRSDNGEEWRIPRGFHSRLRLDRDRCRWTLTHFSGLEVEFFQGIRGKPGFPLFIREPNGNRTDLAYDHSGLLTAVSTDLGQVERFHYDESSRLDAFVDHIGRTWRFRYDGHDRLRRIITPATEFADITASQEVTRRNLDSVLACRPRASMLEYDDARFADHVTAVHDPRGSVGTRREYDDHGRVRRTIINGAIVGYDYDVASKLGVLEAGNRVTRVVDREGNITDYETHSVTGGPLDGRGRFGLRRRITWTERGKGNPPLREDEPEYWEQRWLHDCNCLAPQTVTEPFGSAEGTSLRFDAFGIPTNWPRTVSTYNGFRQKTRDEYTDGDSSIVSEWRYQPGAFGDGAQYSRPVRWTDPRAFQPNAIDTGLDFHHVSEYDARGNRVRLSAPALTRGVAQAQSIVDRWSYNAFGQETVHIDPNGNVTRHEYHQGASTGGDINTQGEIGGYLARTIVGAVGSADVVTALCTEYRTNALGMITRITDPNGNVHETRYNDLQEPVLWIQPPVALGDGIAVRYQMLSIYDGAGNKVIERRTNVDSEGRAGSTPWIDRSMTYDDVHNLMSERVQVDEDEANDLIERYAYDGNDDPAVTRRPEGNRTFWVYDERRLPFKTFTGVGAGPRIADAYPSDKRAGTLNGARFVGLVIDTYDARGNHVRRRDARGNVSRWFFDFYNRGTGAVDPNGNGWTCEFDNASNPLTLERGAVDVESGRIQTPLERTYHRFDEVGRRYQRVRDIALDSNQPEQVDPDDGRNSSYRTRFDPGSRIIEAVDANGNRTRFGYDAAGRRLVANDALGNTLSFSYDSNSNPLAVEETEIANDAAGQRETYLTTWEYDAIDRVRARHVRGRAADPIDHVTRFRYDSRNNLRVSLDAEGRATLTEWDDADRMVRRRRYSADPFAAGSTELVRIGWRYDRNGNIVEERAAREISDPASIEVTRYSYDDLDRRVRKIMPDSDDAPDGSGDGPDGVYDRIEIQYDPNSNPVRVIDQRRVVFVGDFDAGNRLTRERIVGPFAAGGVTRRDFVYDALNRITTAANDFAADSCAYDPLSRVTHETQSLELDGRGFERGWQDPITLRRQYDRQSNRTRLEVIGPDNRSDLTVETGFDPLNRHQTTRAAYFDRPMHDIAAWKYVGPARVGSKRFGNGVALERAYDTKRRVVSHRWHGPAGPLVDFEYRYDRVDNALYERFVHDGGRYDHFGYNARDEVTSVEYRSPVSEPPSDPGTRFHYDDLFNRTQACFGDPLGRRPHTLDCYSNNLANETTSLRRNGHRLNVRHDAAGNPTRFFVRPVAEIETESVAAARWDGGDLLVEIDTAVNGPERYCYDAFRRRVAVIESGRNGASIRSRRFIHDGWEVIEERVASGGTGVGSSLERITVNGGTLDEPLLVAIDRDGDGRLGQIGPLNADDSSTDREYYLLDNRLGSIMALVDASEPARVLESYRYAVFGTPTTLEPGQDLPVSVRAAGSGPDSGFGNTRFFGARVYDGQTGLYYHRHRYYDPVSGRFLGRDPAGPSSGPNSYAYVFNAPTNATDPLGLRVFCVGVQAGFALLIGLGGSVSHCYDDCGNEAYILSGGVRKIIDVGGGVELGTYSGSLAEFLSHPYLMQHTSAVGPVTVGVDEGPHSEPLGGRIGLDLSPIPASLSTGNTYSWILYQNLGRGYPCPPPRPPEWPSVPFAKGDPTSDIPPVARASSPELPGACCCVGWECTSETGQQQKISTAILGVPAGTHPRECDSLCQARGFAIGYGAQQTGRSQQCLPSTTARALRLYRRGLIHYLP